MTWRMPSGQDRSLTRWICYGPRSSAARLPSPAAGVPREPGDSLPVLAAVGQRLMQVLLLTDEIKDVGGIAMEALALEPEGSVLAGVPRRPGTGRRAGIRHRRWSVQRSPQKVNTSRCRFPATWLLRPGQLGLIVDRLFRFGRYLTPGDAARITRRREAAHRRGALGHAAWRPADVSSGCGCSLDRTWGAAMRRPGRSRPRSGPSTRRRPARPG
jgi:hypothetical protein